MGGKKNYYVVFIGRKVGIFKEWSECHTQVVKFKCSAYKGYATRHEADTAWSYFCNTGDVPVDLDEIQESATWSHGSSSISDLSLEGLSLQGDDDRSPRQNTVPKPTDFFIEYSNQALLLDVCQSLRIPPPSFTLLETKTKNGLPHHRYGVCVAYNGPEAQPFFIVRDFHSSHEEAQDNACWLMLKYLVEKVGKRIKDYNYHVVDHLMAQLTIKDDIIKTLRTEIEKLDNELESLKSVLGFSQ